MTKRKMKRDKIRVVSVRDVELTIGGVKLSGFTEEGGGYMEPDVDIESVRCCDCIHDVLVFGGDPHQTIPPCVDVLFPKPVDNTEMHLCSGFVAKGGDE